MNARPAKGGWVSRLLFLILCAFFPAPAMAQGCMCTVPALEGSTRFECESGDSCWLIRYTERRSQGGCFKGRDIALMTPVSGSLRDVPLSEAVATLTLNHGLDVTILGDKTKKVSLEYKDRPLQLVLLDLQQTSGVALEAAWLPKIATEQKISICIHNAKVSRIASLLFSISGKPVSLAPEKLDGSLSLKVNDVTPEQLATEFLKVIRQ